jgi:hypothetical protein|tara:strand:+ start:1282 stop:1764 length:483 start_codon:yes stop_codon:yes gene_type:complete
MVENTRLYPVMKDDFFYVFIDTPGKRHCGAFTLDGFANFLREGKHGGIYGGTDLRPFDIINLGDDELAYATQAKNKKNETFPLSEFSRNVREHAKGGKALTEGEFDQVLAYVWPKINLIPDELETMVEDTPSEPEDSLTSRMLLLLFRPYGRTLDVTTRP